MRVAEAVAKTNPPAVPEVSDAERLHAAEVVRSLGYAALLIWLNAYLCREMFVRYTPHMNSMQGFWIAMARLPGAGWFHSDWWRYWDCGSPFEFVYAPLIPAITAWTAAVRSSRADLRVS